MTEVYIVMADQNDEDPYINSVHASKDGAQSEIDLQTKLGNRGYVSYRIIKRTVMP